MNRNPGIDELKNEIERLNQEKNALQLMAQNYRAIFNDSEDAYYEIDLAGNFTYFNDTLCHILGYPRNELMGMNNRTYTTHETAQTMYAIFNRVYKTGRPARVNDYTVIKKDGRTNIVELSISPLKKPDGTIIGFSGIGRDKTERRKAEVLLKESEQRLTDIINFLPDATLAIDIDGNVIAWNRAIEEMTGVKAEDMLGKGNYEYALPFYGTRRPILIDMVLQKNKDIEKDYHILSMEKDIFIIETDVPIVKGEKAFLWAKASPIYDQSGTIVGAIEGIRDISEQKQSEEALRKSEAKYRELVENANSIILRRDIEGRITFFNEFAQKFFGYDEEEILGENVVGTIIPETESTGRDLASMIRQSYMNPELYITNENENVCRNGERVWVAWTNKAIRNNDGTIREFLCIGTDITKRRKSEEALSVEKAYFEQLFESSPEAIVVVDNNGCLLRVNGEFTRMFGYTRDEAIGKPIDKLIAPEGVLDEALSLTRDVTEGKLISLETIRRRKDGSPVHVSILATPIEAEGGQVAVYGIYRNISERKQAEAALKDSEERLKTILNSLQAGIVIIEAETHRIVEVNPAAIQMIGEPQEAIIGALCHRFICLEGIGQCPLSDPGQTIDTSEGVLTTNNRNIPILKTVTPIVINGSEHFLEIFIDITERKNLEAQLHQAQKMEAIGTLAGGIAHDFNNLLMGIQGRTSLMLMDCDQTHPHYHHLRQQEEMVKSGADLTRQLLGFARGGKYEVTPANINEVVDKSSEMFGRTKKEIIIHRKYEENIGAVEIDRGQMEQVFVNIFVNAWQAMPGGGSVYIETETMTVTDKMAAVFGVTCGRYVKISITDTGVGMNEATKERIFEPFFTTKEMGRGTGLGLASVYGIIKNHEGFIDVQSEKGRGTTFSIYLPATDSTIAAKRTEHQREILSGTETVLLVDDEHMILEVANEILKKLGYTVLLADNGKKAVDIVRKNPDGIDMIILDMVMPEMSGSEALRIIKDIRPDAKVLLSSGYSLHSTANEMLTEGCSGFIQKPFSIEDLSKKIREILTDRPSSKHR